MTQASAGRARALGELQTDLAFAIPLQEGA